MITKLVETVSTVLEKVSRGNIQPFQTKVKEIQQKLSVSLQFWKKITVIGPFLQPLDSMVESMIGFTQTCNIIDPLKKTIFDVLLKTSDFTNIFESRLKNYGTIVKKASEEINSIVDWVSSFLDDVQLRQRGLGIQPNYMPWNEYPHCSVEVCLRSLRRSSTHYLEKLFLWKYPHLDDLSSLAGTGKWPVPGLFDDYKIRGIAQLSDEEMILGMRGVAINKEKASLIVIVDTKSPSGDILKILQLEKDGWVIWAD
jgi:hypothetical protein